MPETSPAVRRICDIGRLNEEAGTRERSTVSSILRKKPLSYVKKLSRVLLQQKPRRRKPSWKVFLLSGLGFAVAIGVVASQLGSTGVRSYPLDVSSGVPTFEQAPAEKDRTPLSASTVSLASGSSRLVPLFDTTDPADAVLKGLQEEWEQFEPTVALVENNVGLTFGTTAALIRNHGLSGAVLGMAREKGIGVYSFNPPPPLVYRTLGKNFSAGALVLYTSLKEFQARTGGEQASDSVMEAILMDQCRSFGLDNCVFGSIAALDDYWGRAYPQLPNWRDLNRSHLTSTTTKEVRSDGDMGIPLGVIGAAYDRFANDYAVASVKAAMRNGDRVLVVAPSDRLEPIANVLHAASNRQKSFRLEAQR